MTASLSASASLCGCCAGGQAHGQLLSVLQELSGLNGLINALLLSQTQVGHVVNRLTRLPAGSTDAQALAVRDTAKAIIAQWKDKVKPRSSSTPAAAPTAASASPSAQIAAAGIPASPIVQQLSVTVAFSTPISSSSLTSLSSSSSAQQTSASPVSPLPPPSATRSVTSPSLPVVEDAGSAGTTRKRKSVDGRQDGRDELRKRQAEMKEALQSSSGRNPAFSVKTDFTPSSPPSSQPSPSSSSASFQLGKHADATRNKVREACSPAAAPVLASVRLAAADYSRCLVSFAVLPRFSGCCSKPSAAARASGRRSSPCG